MLCPVDRHGQVATARLPDRAVARIAQRTAAGLGHPDLARHTSLPVVRRCIREGSPHRDEESRPVEEVVDTFAALVADGRARAWAVSNWSAQRIDAAVAAARDAGVPAPVAVQDEGSALVPTDPAVVAAADRAGMLELPYSTLASGFLTGSYTRDGAAPDSPRAAGVREKRMTDRGWAVLDAVRSVAEQRGVAVASVALAWLRSRGTVPIASARSTRQLGDLLAATRIELSADEVPAITRAGA